MKNSTTAKVVKDNIVISFDNSENPKIWNSTLSETLSFELNITDKKNSISVKKDDGKKEVIASYKTKDVAEKAYQNISEAMFVGDKSCSKSKKSWKSTIFFIIVIIVFALYMIAKNRPNMPVSNQMSSVPTIGNLDSSSKAAAPKMGSSKPRSGVPIDASEMFK